MLTHGSRQPRSWLIFNVGRRMKSKAHLVLVLLLATALRALGALEFAGFMSDARAIRFVLTDTETGTHSAWISVGQSFRGYTIVDFEIKSEILVVQHDSQILRLPLRASKIRDDSAAPAPSTITVSFGDQSSISVRDEPALLAALEVELRRAATLSPQPTVAIRASEKTPMSVLRAVFDLCKKSGLQKISLSTQ